MFKCNLVLRNSETELKILRSLVQRHSDWATATFFTPSFRSLITEQRTWCDCLRLLFLDNLAAAAGVSQSAGMSKLVSHLIKLILNLQHTAWRLRGNKRNVFKVTELGLRYGGGLNQTTLFPIACSIINLHMQPHFAWCKCLLHLCCLTVALVMKLQGF